MKGLICLLSGIMVLGIMVVPTHADTANYQDFTRRMVEIFGDCQKVKAGMTRAELVKLAMFDEDRGPLFNPNDNSFRPHTTFQYRAYSLIKIDVDFIPSVSKAARPTDVIAKVSLPFIDARPRR